MIKPSPVTKPLQQAYILPCLGTELTLSAGYSYSLYKCYLGSKPRAINKKLPDDED